MSLIVYEDNYFASSKRVGGFREIEAGKGKFFWLKPKDSLCIKIWDADYFLNLL